MTLVVNSNLAAATVTYNTVQFGGGDSAYGSTPPVYKFRGRFEYDQSGRAVVGTVYTLSVTCIFVEATEGAMANSASFLKRLLSQPRKDLKIVGLGTGFGTIATDEKWGPKPLAFDWMPLGPVSWQCTWEVEFFVKECNSHHQDRLAFAAFNFDTTWQNDFEGLCQRTIAGYAEIAIHTAANRKTPINIADDIRDRINIITPQGFRRTQNTWRMNDAFNRLDFVVTDEVMPGDPLPQGCTVAEGDVTYNSQGPGFAEAQVTMSMFLKTSPSFPRTLGAVIFLTAAQNKQAAMASGLGGNPKATVVPIHIHLSNGKFDRARETSASMTWSLTKCIGSMMAAAGIYEPLTSDTYNLWRTSIQNLWGNRGAALVGGSPIRGVASEAVVIDLCDNVTSVTIGATSTPQAPPTNNSLNFSFTCPDIPADGGWIGHDMRIRILRKDEQSWHKKAISYLPEIGSVLTGGTGVPGQVVPLGGPTFLQTEADEHAVEFHGLPVMYVLLQFKGLRIKRLPQMPEIRNIAGKPVYLEEQQIDGPRIAFDAICPVHFIRGYRIYRVNGPIASIKAVESETSCAAPNGSNQNF